MSRSVFSTFDRGIFFGGVIIFLRLKITFWVLLPLGSKVSSFYACKFAFLDRLHNFWPWKNLGGDFFSHGKKLNFRAFLPLRLRFRSFDTYKLCLGQFTALLTVEIFSRGGWSKFFHGWKSLFECYYLLALRLVHFKRVNLRFWIGYIIFDHEKI